MFDHGVPPVAYSDPWNKSFEDRFAALRRGGTRIAYYYHVPDNSTFRYRCYNMAQAVNALLPGVSASHFHAADGEGLLRVVESADVLVVCRARYTDFLNRLITRAKGLGRRVVYDIDDLVFDSRFVHLLVDTLDQEPSEAAWEHWFAYVGRLGATLRLCDRVVVTNDQLVERVAAFSGTPARVVPNFMNREQVDLSRRIFAAKKATGFASRGPIRIGYFSGTPTHNRDFALVAPVLARLLDCDTRLRLALVGFLDPDEALRRHAGRVDRIGLQDFVNLQRALGEAELNLVPLQDNVFTNCKSDLKYFEAAAVGTVTVATPTIPYRQAIRDGVNGFLAKSHQWEAQLARVLDGLADYPLWAQRAHEDAMAAYDCSVQGAAIAAAILAE